MIEQRLGNTLRNDPLREKLITHSFFGRIPEADLSRGQVATFLGQWWHPLHYFPTFLSRLVSVVPSVEQKTAIAKILFQELGEGDPARAHEVVYVNTMLPLGFGKAELTGAPPLPATARLIAAYAESSIEPFAGLGLLYGTEVADLAMVSGIGTAVRRVTGATRLDWVDIHVEQEPEHVARANDTVSIEFTESEEAALLAGAEVMWRHWIAFFDELDRRIFSPKMVAAAS